MAAKDFKDIHTSILNLRQDILFEVSFEDCCIDLVILPVMCRQIVASTSIIKCIHLNKHIEVIYCDNCGIEEIIAEEPILHPKAIILNDNKLIKFNVQMLEAPYELNISNNQITEIKYKIPFNYFFFFHGNPISREADLSDYIDFPLPHPPHPRPLPKKQSKQRTK